MKVVVCGGGAVDAACAYFLGRRGADVVVVERTGVACAASGKSGGFLALDWCDGFPLEALARRSFYLHEALVDEIGVDWGYRRVTTYCGVSGPHGDGPGPLPWLSDAVTLHGRIGSPATTAHIHPAHFTSRKRAPARDRGRPGGARHGAMVDPRRRLARPSHRLRGQGTQPRLLRGHAG